MPQLVDVGSSIYICGRCYIYQYIYHLIRKATDSSTRHSVDEGGVEPDSLRGMTLLDPEVR